MGVAAAVGLFAVQALIATLRVHGRRFETAVDNAPLLLVERGRIIEPNLRRPS